MENSLIHRYDAIRKRIHEACRASGRKPESVALIAVSKTKPFSMIEELYRAGHRDFGENYVQELVKKAEEAERAGLREIRWHFIGHLQTNKVKQLLPHLNLIHSVDSEKLLRELEKRAESLQCKVRGLIEVNLDEEDSKTGVVTSQLSSILTVAKEMKYVRIEGLMAIPDPDRAEGAKFAFEELARLAREFELPVLSMGMTSDFEEAIRAGSTFVRVGTAIFGGRS